MYGPDDLSLKLLAAFRIISSEEKLENKLRKTFQPKLKSLQSTAALLGKHFESF